MKIAFAISGKRPGGDALEVAKLVATRGISEVWVTEDYIERGAFALAGAVLGAVEDVRAGIGVVNPWTRHPVLTAMETAALYEIAPGRITLGLGASNPRWMHDQLGITFERPLMRLHEAVDLIRAALKGGSVDHDGLTGTIHAQMIWEPADVPIVLGVKGPDALAMAGRVADGVLLSVLSSPAYVRWSHAHVAADLPLGISSYVAVDLHDDREIARERIKPLVAHFLGVHGDHAITRVAGIEPELSGLFREGWRRQAPRIDLVTDEILDTFVVAGDRDDVAAGLRRFVDAGLRTAALNDPRAPQLGAMIDDIAAAARDAGLDM